MENWDALIICVFVGFAASFGVTAYIVQVWCRRQLPPRAVEFHHGQNPAQPSVSRLGGIALAAAFVGIISISSTSFFGFKPDNMLWTVAGTTLAMFGLGLWDDLRALGAKRKLTGQLIIASIAYFCGLGFHMFKIPLVDRIVDLGPLAWPATVFWLVAMTNLINLIDGADGLAGGIALMLMLLLAVVGKGMESISLVAAGMLGALLAFLRFNFPPAKIYLGDGGAYFLGFLIGALTICNSHKGTVVAALIAPLFVLALPILDTSLALLRRGLNGLPLFRPDRRHLHHRLLQSGLSRQGLILWAYAFTGVFLGFGLVAFWFRGQFLALWLGAATLTLLLTARQFRFSREWFNIGSILQKSLQARSEIRYALDQSRWLGMEGQRGRNVQGICDDTAFVADKLGFFLLRIKLEDSQQIWKMTPDGWQKCRSETNSGYNSPSPIACTGAEDFHTFRHQLPGHTTCFLELQMQKLDHSAFEPSQTEFTARQRLKCVSKIEIVSEVLAEGWARSLTDWHRRNHLPVRFDNSVLARRVTPELSQPLSPLVSNSVNNVSMEGMKS